MSDEPILILNMRVRFEERVQVGAIFVPDLDDSGNPQSTGLLLSDEQELARRNPPIWCVYGPAGWYTMRRIENSGENN